MYSKQISASTGKKPKTGYRQDIASPFVTTTLLSPTTFNSAAIPRNSAAVSVGFSSSCHRLHHTLLLLPSITLALHLYTTPPTLEAKKAKTSSKKATFFWGGPISYIHRPKSRWLSMGVGVSAWVPSPLVRIHTTCFRQLHLAQVQLLRTPIYTKPNLLLHKNLLPLLSHPHTLEINLETKTPIWSSHRRSLSPGRSFWADRLGISVAPRTADTKKHQRICKKRTRSLLKYGDCIVNKRTFSLTRSVWKILPGE